VVLSQRENATLTSAQVFPLLSYNDPLIQTEALRVIQSHPEWIPETQKQLDDWLSAPEITEETAAHLRGFLVAMFDRKEIRESVRQALDKPETSEAVRLFLLETLDLVSGMIFSNEWVATLKPGLRHENEQVVLQTLRLLRKDDNGRFDPELLAVFEQHRQSPEVALAALTALAPRLNPAPDSAVEFLLTEMQDADQTLSSLKAAETLVLLPELSRSQQDQLAKTLPQTPAHVLPVLQEFVKSSSPAVQQAYLSSVIAHKSADRFSASDLADWSQRTSSEEVRSLLKQVQTARLAAIGERKSKLDGLIAHLTSGDPKKGEQVFFSRRAACASCHRIESQGGQVGPDLSQIGRIRTQRDLLEAIVFPSASFARGYEPFTVVTESGRTYNGVIESETANEIVLRTTDQRTIRLPHSEIEVLKQSEVSVMPQGIDKLLSPAELQDLLAFLKSRQAGKEVAENKK
jgi:putative heme-binding domain-containing protein